MIPEHTKVGNHRGLRPFLAVEDWVRKAAEDRTDGGVIKLRNPAALAVREAIPRRSLRFAHPALANTLADSSARPGRIVTPLAMPRR